MVRRAEPFIPYNQADDLSVSNLQKGEEDPGNLFSFNIDDKSEKTLNTQVEQEQEEFYKSRDRQQKEEAFLNTLNRTLNKQDENPRNLSELNESMESYRSKGGTRRRRKKRNTDLDDLEALEQEDVKLSDNKYRSKDWSRFE